jgi:hypothetical protein
MVNNMPAVETAIKEWAKLPSGRLVSADRMQRNGKTFSLYDAKNMDIEAFNTEAARYDVHIEPEDQPIDRLVKVTVYQSKRDNDGSFLPTNEEYVGMVLDTAAANSKPEADRTEEEQALLSFYKTLTTGPLDTVREILEFQEKLTTGANKDKYIATLLRFNEDAELEPVDNIIIAPEGWMRILGARHRYPTETSKSECAVENLENPSIEGNDIRGYWYVGSEPERGEQRLALRGPDWLDAGLFSAGVAALRLRDVRPEDYIAETIQARAEAKQT